MATKGTNTGSNNSPKISSEIEKRLQVLEAKAHTPCNGGGGDAKRIAELEAKVDELIRQINKKIPINI